MFNNSDRDVFEEIELAALELAEPEDYYHGIGTPVMETPRNILMFRRTSPSHIRGTGSLQIHHHYRFVLIICLKMPGSVIIDGGKFRMHPQKALLIFPHQHHHYMGFDSPAISWLFITFELINPEWLIDIKNKAISLEKIAGAYLAQFIWSYLHKQNAKHNAHDQVSLHLGLVLSVLMDLAEPEHSRKVTVDEAEYRDQSVVDRVNNFIFTNVDRPLCIAEIARQVSLSGSHLRRIYKKEMGITIHTYIHRVRMNRAVKFLSTTRKNISEIAELCGFDSLYSFSRAFKHTLRESPSLYRKKIIQQIED